MFPFKWFLYEWLEIYPLNETLPSYINNNSPLPCKSSLFVSTLTCDTVSDRAFCFVKFLNLINVINFLDLITRFLILSLKNPKHYLFLSCSKIRLISSWSLNSRIIFISISSMKTLLLPPYLQPFCYIPRLRDFWGKG